MNIERAESFKKSYKKWIRQDKKLTEKVANRIAFQETGTPFILELPCFAGSLCGQLTAVLDLIVFLEQPRNQDGRAGDSRHQKCDFIPRESEHDLLLLGNAALELRDNHDAAGYEGQHER